MLHINDKFFTVQGEGGNVGRRALFVRMPKCNLACSWCDTTFETFEKISEVEFATFATKEPARFAVVTGGEPMLHRHTPRVVEVLKRLGFEVACETNGTAPIVAGVDYVTISPKRQSYDERMGRPAYYVHPHAYSQAAEFKYVVDSEFNWKTLDRHANDPEHVRLSLSPEFGRFEASVSEILDFVAKNPRWRLSLQTHKIIGVQ